MRRDGKVAIVTGASSGIGQASAKALHQAGFRVFGTSRRAVASTLEGITMVTCDVTDDASVKAAVDKVLDMAGKIGVLVNNAGTGLLAGAEESSVNQAQALFDVNLFGVIRTTNAVLPIMRQQKAGRIINISSVLGFIPAPFSVPSTPPRSMLSKAIRNPLTMKCGPSAFEFACLSRRIPALHSNKTCCSRIGVWTHMSRRECAPAWLCKRS